jgi:hypothetical protein
LEYSAIDESTSDLVFKEGLSFEGEDYSHQAKTTYQKIEEEFESGYEMYGNHLFDLFIDGDLMETFSCDEETAKKVLDKYYSGVPFEKKEESQ